MRMPKIDIKELEKMKEENFRERLIFIDRYSEWLKNHSDKQSKKQLKKHSKDASEK